MLKIATQTGRTGRLSKRSGAITISTLFTAAVPPTSSIASIFEGAFARLAQHTHLFNTETSTTRCTSFLQRSNVTRSLLGFKRGRCQRHATASQPPAETSFSTSLHTLLRKEGQVDASHSVSPDLRETHEILPLVSVLQEIVTQILQNQYLVGRLTTSAPPVWDTGSYSVREQQSQMA